MTVDRGPGPFTEEQWESLMSLRRFFSSGHNGLPGIGIDRASDTPVGRFLANVSSPGARCSCLVCACSSIRTIENPVVCAQCKNGAHEGNNGGVL